MKTLPLTTLILIAAVAAGLLGAAGAGWLLFGAGALTWMLRDAHLAAALMTGDYSERSVKRMARYSTPPVMAWVAYQVLGADDVIAGVSIALALHAVFVLAGLGFMGYQLMQIEVFPHEKGISRSI